MSKLFVVVGGQFGSEGKGAVAGRICQDHAASGRAVVNVRVGGPNAGHTVLGRCPEDCEEYTHEGDVHPWRLRQVPVGAVTNEASHLMIAAGSEVDLEVLREELSGLDSAGYNASHRLTLDLSATLLTLEHKAQEAERGLNSRIGSTAKGIGAARADRLWRTATTVGQQLLPGLSFGNTAYLLHEYLRQDAVVVVEGTQGYGLGLHTDNYPQVTSGDCRAIDFLSQAGISPWQSSLEWDHRRVDLRIVVCLRPYPIRVAGNSGPLRGETDWETLGLPVEYTTVTQKVRRVGTWDDELAVRALRANGGPCPGTVYVAMTMMDSVDPELAGRDAATRGWNITTSPKSALGYLHSIGLDTRSLGYVGTGPNTALVNTEMYL